MRTTLDRTTRQDQEKVVLNFVCQFLDGNLSTMPDIHRAECEALASVIGTSREQREGTLANIRRMPQHKAFDSLLKRGFDKPDETQETTGAKVPSNEIGVPDLEYGILDPALAIGACPWLDEHYVPFSRKWSPRAPEIHHIGCGLWVLSTIAMRRIAVKEGRTVQHTPLYVMLVAPTSVWGKTTTAQIAVDLIKTLGLSWLLCPDSTTPEKFLLNLASKDVPENYDKLNEAQKELVRLKLAHSGQRGWYYSEFGQLLREMSDIRGRNAAFKSIFLRMDDCEDTYQYDTASRGLAEIELPYLSLLGTMTPECMRPYSGSEASSWGDGFYARFAFCCVPLDKKKTRTELENEQFPSEDGTFSHEVVKPLRAFHEKLQLRSCKILSIPEEKGKKDYIIERETMSEYPLTVLKLSSDARKALNDYGNALALRAQDDELVQFRGYYSRLRDKTLRMATLFAALQNSQNVEIQHIARAQQIAEQFRHSIHQLGMHLSIATASSATCDDKVTKLLALKDKPLTAREIQQCVRGLNSAKDTQECLASLVSSGQIESDNQRPPRYTLGKN